MVVMAVFRARKTYILIGFDDKQYYLDTFTSVMIIVKG